MDRKKSITGLFLRIISNSRGFMPLFLLNLYLNRSYITKNKIYEKEGEVNMYIELKNEQDIEKVMAFLKKEKISFDKMKSSHEVIVKNEADYLMNHQFPEMIKEHGRAEGWDDEKIEKHLNIIQEIINEIKEDANNMIIDEESFVNLQDMIEKSVLEELDERISN